MSIDKDQWNLITTSVVNTRQEDRVQQQMLYRLFESVKNNDSDMIKKLLHQGLFIDAPFYKSGTIAVPLASQIFPSDYPFQEITASGLASYTGDVDGLSLLCTYGSDIFFPVSHGRDVLNLAILSGQNTIWDWIIHYAEDKQLSIPWNQRATDGTRLTRLMDAVIHRAFFAVQDIVSHVNVAAWDSTGKTALHHNFLQDPYTELDHQIAQLLIEYGAPTHVEDYEGVSIAALANKAEHEAVLDKAVLLNVTAEAKLKAEEQRNKIKASAPEPERDPSEPQFPQIQKPVKFKRYI